MRTFEDLIDIIPEEQLTKENVKELWIKLGQQELNISITSKNIFITMRKEKKLIGINMTKKKDTNWTYWYVSNEKEINITEKNLKEVIKQVERKLKEYAQKLAEITWDTWKELKDAFKR